jgi:Mn2+/Fe2+ NRAMP family transporter
MPKRTVVPAALPSADSGRPWALWTAIINGFLAPPLLAVVMIIANNTSVLGPRVNGRFANIVGWTTTTVMFVAALALVIVLVR